MKVKHNLKPIYDKNSKVLILGSMPSVISRVKSFYYANKQNRFWSVLEIIFNTKLESEEKKKEFLLKNKIALWDVIESCEIDLSTDASIKNVKVNNINKILKTSNIKCIFCTGKKAYDLFNKYIKVDVSVKYLPSTSSANASKHLEDLVSDYSAILDYLD